MQAKSKRPYPVTAFTGREYVRYEWRDIPAGCEAEARRLASEEGGSVLLLKNDEAVDFVVPKGSGLDTVEIEQFDVELEQVPVIEPEPTLAVDLEKKTVTELRDMARDAGITIGRKSKAELIDALKDD